MLLSRVTQICERVSGNISGRSVAIIDTPGLVTINRIEKPVIREILKSVSIYNPGPHVFLHVLTVGNLTSEEKNMHKLIENMFGKDVWKYAVILFTPGDRLEGKFPNYDIASSDKDLRDLVCKCSGGFVVFNNKDVENSEQVSKLLEKIETLMAKNATQPPFFQPPKER